MNGLPFYFLRGLKLHDKKYISSVDKNGKISQILEDRKVIGIQPFIASMVESPGQINIIRPLEKISVVLGSPYEFKPMPDLLKEVASIFNEADIKTSISSRGIHRDILEKLRFSMTINVLSAITERSIDHVFDDPKNSLFLRYTICLLDRLAVNLGIGNLYDYDQFKSLSVTKGHFSSLYHDTMNKKQTEIEVIVEAPLELCRYVKERERVWAQLPILRPLEVLRALLMEKIENTKEGIKLTQDEMDNRMAFLTKSCRLALDLMPPLGYKRLERSKSCDNIGFAK